MQTHISIFTYTLRKPSYLTVIYSKPKSIKYPIHQNQLCTVVITIKECPNLIGLELSIKSPNNRQITVIIIRNLMGKKRKGRREMRNSQKMDLRTDFRNGNYETRVIPWLDSLPKKQRVLLLSFIFLFKLIYTFLFCSTQ